jgi:hypothetical protein
MRNVAKSVPEQVIVPEQGAALGTLKQLPSLEKFRTEVLPLLTLVPRPRVDALISALYRTAEKKVELELQRTRAHNDKEMLRSNRSSRKAAMKLLSDALNLLSQTKDQYKVELEQIEFAVELEDFRFRFDDIIQHLKDAVEAAANFQLADAGQVHPHLRKKAERQLAQEKIAGEVVAGSIVPHDYPARPKSPNIDHWFIGELAACLDKYPRSGGRKIPAYGHIISEIFRIAFGDDRADDSVRQELGRQKMAGRPTYDLPSDLYVVPTRSSRQKKRRSSDHPSKAPLNPRRKM